MDVNSFLEQFVGHKLDIFNDIWANIFVYLLCRFFTDKVLH